MPERDETHGNITAALLCIYQVQFCKELSFSLIVKRAAHDISLTYVKTSSHIQWDNFSKLCQFSCRALLDSQKQPDVLRRNPKIILWGRTTGQLPHVSAGQLCSPQPAPCKMLLPDLIISLQSLHLLLLEKGLQFSDWKWAPLLHEYTRRNKGNLYFKI